MAHFWIRRDGEWVTEPLVDDWSLLSPPVLRDRRYTIDEPDPDATTVAILRVPGSQGDAWILMAGRQAHVRINGLPASGGLRLLCDRDEILAGGARRYFSSESLPAVEPFAGAAAAVVCPRCRQAIDPGTPAVRCPGCRIWHHQAEALPCWSYADTCALCPQPTDLAAGYRWTPEADAL